MTVCRVRRHLALAAAALLALPAGAVAQVETEPAPLTAPDPFEDTPPALSIETEPTVPSVETAPAAPPIEAAPAPGPVEIAPTDLTAPDQPDPTETTGPATADEGGISVGPLGELSSGSAGTLDPGEGGLDPDLWADTKVSRLIALFGRLPADARSPAMHDLARRMMLSTTAPPDLDAPIEDFIAARLATLNRLGAFDDAVELAALLPGSAIGDAARWHAAESLFWADDVIGACALVRDQIRVTPTRPWRKALMFCQATAGETDAAGLSLALLRDRADEADTGFLTVAAKLIGELTDAPPALDDGLSFAATIAAEIAIPPDLVADLPPAAGSALTRLAQLDVETRLAAAERAASFGSLSPEGLAAAYSEPTFSEAELSDARGQAGDTPGQFGRALLFQAIRKEQESDQRAGLLSALFDAPGGPGFGPLARAAGVPLLSISPADTVLWFASDAVPALVAGSRFEAAQAWYLGLAELAVRQPEAKQVRVRTLPLLAAVRVGPGRSWEPSMAADWWAALPESYDAAARATAATPVFMTLDALGIRVGPDAWDLFEDAPPTTDVEIPNIGVRYAMRDAARANRIGETALWAMIALGNGGPIGADAITLGSVIRSMRAVGLDEEARALAVEALIEASR